MTTKLPDKSLTAAAIRYRREAHIERLCKPIPALAPMWDRAADALLTLPAVPNVGPGGEVVNEQPPPDGNVLQVSDEAHWKRRDIINTLAEGATRIAEDASIARADLLLQRNLGVLAMAIDAADSVQAANSVERMLAHQMATAHEVAMKMADRSLHYMSERKAADNQEAVRCINATARLMSAFNDAALTLQRLRTGGSQTVTVQHVTVAHGGQAVIGNVQPGAGAQRGRISKNG